VEDAEDVTVCAVREFGKGIIVAISSRWMFSNTLIGENIDFLRGILELLFRTEFTRPDACGSEHYEAEEETADSDPDRWKTRMQSLLQNPANLFMFLMADGFFQMVAPRTFTKDQDLSLPWCEPVWIENSFSRCVRRIERHERVRNDWHEMAMATLNRSTPGEILGSIHDFPLKGGHLLRVRGLYEPFMSFQKRVESLSS